MKELLLIGFALIALPAIIFVSLRLYELNGEPQPLPRRTAMEAQMVLPIKH